MVLAEENVRTSVFRFAERMERLKPSAIREILKTTGMPHVISFAGGLPAPELFPVAEFKAACDEVLDTDGAQALQYSVTEGYPPLRTWIADYVAETNGFACRPEEVLVVSGSQQGLDLIGKVLLDPGDFVVMENPAYLGAIQAFDAYQASYLSVATDDFGMVPDDLHRVLRSATSRPKMIYIVPNFANPTGVTLALERREALIEIARQHRIPIFEDDPYGRLRYSGEHIRSIASLTGGDGIIYMSTVSKIIAPGMRVAWLVIPDEELFERVVPAKHAAGLSRQARRDARNARGAHAEGRDLDAAGRRSLPVGARPRARRHRSAAAAGVRTERRVRAGRPVLGQPARPQHDPPELQQFVRGPHPDGDRPSGRPPVRSDRRLAGQFHIPVRSPAEHALAVQVRP